MPLALALIGLLLTAAAIRGQHKELGDLWKQQFTGPQSFLGFAFVLAAIGMVGVIGPLKPVVRAMLILVVVVFLIVQSAQGDLVSRAREQLTQ